MTTFIASGQPIIGEEERAAVDRVLRSGMLAQGPEVAAFEREFAAEFGLDRPCVAVNSGTSGLHLGLLAAGIGAGDEVIVPSFTFAATANAVALTRRPPRLRRHRSQVLLRRSGSGRGVRDPANRSHHARAPIRPSGGDGPAG